MSRRIPGTSHGTWHKNIILRNREMWISVLILPLIGFVTLSSLSNFSVPQFPHL